MFVLRLPHVVGLVPVVLLHVELLPTSLREGPLAGHFPLVHLSHVLGHVRCGANRLRRRRYISEYARLVLASAAQAKFGGLLEIRPFWIVLMVRRLAPNVNGQLITASLLFARIYVDKSHKNDNNNKKDIKVPLEQFRTWGPDIVAFWCRPPLSDRPTYMYKTPYWVGYYSIKKVLWPLLRSTGPLCLTGSSWPCRILFAGPTVWRCVSLRLRTWHRHWLDRWDRGSIWRSSGPRPSPSTCKTCSC